LTLMLKKLPS